MEQENRDKIARIRRMGEGLGKEEQESGSKRANTRKEQQERARAQEVRLGGWEQKSIERKASE
jgi:hypothetical protein